MDLGLVGRGATARPGRAFWERIHDERRFHERGVIERHHVQVVIVRDPHEFERRGTFEVLVDDRRVGSFELHNSFEVE